jgi:hypothetical protein
MKTRRKNERRTACSLQTRSASLTHGRAYSAKEPDNKAPTTLGEPRSAVSPHRRAYSAKETDCAAHSRLTAMASRLSKANKLSQPQSDLRTGGPHSVGLPPLATSRQLFGFHFRCLFETQFTWNKVREFEFPTPITNPKRKILSNYGTRIHNNNPKITSFSTEQKCNDQNDEKKKTS